MNEYTALTRIHNTNDNEENSEDVPLLRRELRPRDVFCIRVSTVIGAGFYIRTGPVEAMGGPGFIVCAYGLLGLLAWAISQDLARILRKWPVRAPMVTFVEAFVDKEMAVTVGLLYWLMHCFCSAVSTAILGDLVNEISHHKASKTAITAVMTFGPILINLTSVQHFKKIQLIFASFQLIAALCIIFTMMAINPQVAESHPHGAPGRGVVFPRTPDRWMSFFDAIFYLSFAFVGVEAVMSTLMEEDFRPYCQYNSSREGPLRDSTFHQPALVPCVATSLYILGGWIVAENTGWNGDRPLKLEEGRETSGSLSIFVDSARDSSTGLGVVVTILIVVSISSTSSATLYSASRSLFGLAGILCGDHDGTAHLSHQNALQHIFKKTFAVLAKKNKHHVPWVAVLVSCSLTSITWVLTCINPETMRQAIFALIEMTSICCLLVWCCVLVAALLFYMNLRPLEYLDEDYGRDFPVRDSGWYYRHTTITILAAFFCFVIVLAAVVKSVIRKGIWQMVPVPCFLIVFLTVVLKSWKSLQDGENHFRIPSLIDYDTLPDVLRRLNSQGSTRYENYELFRATDSIS